MRTTCLQHVPFEGPGIFALQLAQRGVRVEPHLVPKAGLPKDPGDILLIMGGPMSVNDPDSWIAEETAFIKSAIESGMPVLGICLGSQFMAKALGATVGPGVALEVGMTPIQLTEAGSKDPVFGGAPERFEVFEWHGEVFDLPKGACCLASSDLCGVQAFRLGSHAYGLLFHLEMQRRGIEALCRECPQDLSRACVSAEALLQRADPHLPRLHQLADRLIDHLIAPAH